jgi:putative endonuclease
MSEFLALNEEERTSTATSRLGDAGELLAERYLLKHGYRIVISNFKVPVGRNSKGVRVTGEVDIVALDGDVLCFVEVKTRSSDEFVAPPGFTVRSFTLQKCRTVSMSSAW